MDVTRCGPGKHAWLALADAEHCRLFHCTVTERHTQHIDEQDAIENTLPEQEHARPMSQGGMTHHVEERERRFAGQIVEWLQKKVGEHAIDRLVILAPPRMLGVLRKIPLGWLTGRLEELQGDLTQLQAGQLVEHPMVRDLVWAMDERPSER